MTFSVSLNGQKRAISYDSIFLKKNTTILLKDGSLKFDKDTLLILPDSVFYQVENRDFYRSLRSRWYQRRFTRRLFDLLFSLPSDNFRLDTTNLIQSEKPFLNYQGKVIGNIALTKLQALGTRIDSLKKRPQSVVHKLGNTINFRVKDQVIYNNLLFNPGDTINPSQLADNERILRDLPFIKDARIIIQPRENSDTVDVQLITKDVLSLSVDAESKDFESAEVGVNHRNIFGLGHEVGSKFSVDNDADQTFSYELRYRISNIKNTFTSLEIGYANTENHDFTQLKINREFVTPQIKYAGGLEWSQQSVRQIELINIVSDLDFERTYLFQKYDYQDVWLARSFPLKITYPILRDRTRIITSARVSRIKYLDRPQTSIDANKLFHNRFLTIGSVGFSQRRFFKDQLIFGYGRTEDIPYGFAIELIGGYEWGEFYDRNYYGMRLSQGHFIGKAGYFMANLSLEGYLYQKKWEQGVIKTDFRFISTLIDLNRWKFRQFITINYTKGLNRFDNEFIDIRDKNGIRGLTSHTLRGTQRFLLNIETVSFTPLEVLGFRFAVFGFYDLGFINYGNENIFNEKSQHGIGFGIRVRNDNLTFKAIELRLAFYPDAPVGIENTDIDFSGNSGFRFTDFLIGKPQINNFR